MSIVIRGGRVVTAEDERVADVLIEGERIAAVGEGLSGDEVIDATGRYVIPGGIDPHTHLDTPGTFFDVVTVDDFTSGTIAAAFGGTTTEIDFCTQLGGQTFPEALAGWHAKMERCPPVIDVGFHMAVTDLSTHGTLEDLAALVDQGVTSFKLFMAYKGGIMVDDETLFKTMLVAADAGALVLVHAENGDAIHVLVQRALAEGKVDPVWHARTRPPLTEAEATNRAIMLAQVAGCPLYVVHVSCREAVEPIARARATGWDVWGETCTQYLFIDETMLEQPDFEGAKYVFTPPPRTKDQHDHIWAALAAGDLSVVSTDHAPFAFRGMKDRGKGDFSKIPNGAPGIEDRLKMLHTFGVRTGRMSMSKLVDLTATAPAKLFGLYPRKGAIQPGADADIVVFDPERRRTISVDDPATHHSKIDYNLFEGTEVVGWPERVLVRGTVVVDGDELVASPGHGRFVKRARFGAELS